MYALKNALLIDGTGALPLKNTTLLIEKNKIIAIGTNITVPDSATTIDLSGKTIMPGFIEAHLHMGGITDIADLQESAFGGREYTHNFADLRDSSLKYGVTTVRSCGDYLHDAIALREDIASGRLSGPRIVTCGRSFQRTGGHPGSTVWQDNAVTLEAAAALPETAQQARSMVRELVEAKVDFIKIIINSVNLVDVSKKTPKITAEIVQAIVAEAHKYNKLVAAHCENAADALFAVQSGVDDIEHLILPSSAYVTQTPPDVYHELFALMAARGTYLTPTAIVSAMHDSNVPFSTSTNYRYGSRIFKQAFDAGVKLTMGTDSGAPGVYHGITLHSELEIMVNEQGIPALDVIAAVTKTNSELLGVSDTIGTVEAGKLADLLIVSGNPVEDIRATKNIELVMRDGKIVVDNRSMHC